MAGEVLEVPQFIPSVETSFKQLGFNFVYNAPKVWNKLPYEIHSVTSLLSFRKKLKAYLIIKAYLPHVLSYSLIVPVVLTPFCVSGL